MDQLEPEREEGVTRAGSERWLSVHLYDPAGTRDALLEGVPAVLRGLYQRGDVDSFFFVRYQDEQGPHVRLRLRLLRAAQPCWEWILATVGERFPSVRSPYEWEVDRYGGEEALPYSLAFFTVSSAHALAFEHEFGGLPNSRRMTLALCVLLWQAWGFAESEQELRALLGYYSLGKDLYPEMMKLAEDMFRRSGEKLVELVGRELQRLATLGDSRKEPVSLSSAGSLVAAARALSEAIRDLNPAPRWSVGTSQMHMTANRLGLTNPQETYTSEILCRTAEEIASSNLMLWRQVQEAFARRPDTVEESAAGALSLRDLAQRHVLAVLEET